MKTRVLCIFAALLASPVAALETISANYLAYSPESSNIVGSILGGPWGDEVDISLTIGRFLMERTGGTADAVPLGGTLTNHFLAFCVEPQQFLAASATYELVPLSQAASGIGGIGNVAALQLRELFGRFAPGGGFADNMPTSHAAAFQVAIWEIVSDQAGSLNLSSGNFSMVRDSNSAIFDLAQGWLNSIDGTGPLAAGLRALRNGTLGDRNSGSQDILIFTRILDPIPEPNTWVMITAGFGLIGTIMRRRMSFNRGATPLSNKVTIEEQIW